jgi:glycosyltransferase involved in cell wall biosynthesis
MRITANPRVFSRYPSAWRQSARHVLELVSHHRVDLIHVHHPVGALYAIPAARRLGLPLVLHLHDGPPVKPLYSLALRHAVRHADRIICVSETARELVAATRADPGRVSVIHNGVDRVFLDGTHTRTPEVTGPGPHIGVFGVIEPRKGQDVFLRAAARLVSILPSAHFWIVGPLALADKAEYGRKLEALVRDAPLHGRVTFTGFRPDVARWMMAMDVVALTSVANESFGMVLAEALVLGRKVVASDSGGISEVIQDGITSRLVPPGDAAALAKAILALLQTGEASLHARATAAAVRERFSPEAFTARVAALYDSLPARNRKS